MVYVEVYPGDRVRMRKPHPCGSYEWAITRTGTDVGMVCAGCGHRVMMPRGKFNKGVKQVIPGERRGQPQPEP